MRQPNFVAYSIGTILFGFIMALGPWLMVSIWNRFVPKHTFNPWSLALGVEVGLLALFALGPNPEGQDPTQRWVLLAGVMPALVFCANRWHRHRQGKPEKPGL